MGGVGFVSWFPWWDAVCCCCCCYFGCCFDWRLLFEFVAAAIVIAAATLLPSSAPCSHTPAATTPPPPPSPPRHPTPPTILAGRRWPSPPPRRRRRPSARSDRLVLLVRWVRVWFRVRRRMMLVLVRQYCCRVWWCWIRLALVVRWSLVLINDAVLARPRGCGDRPRVDRQLLPGRVWHRGLDRGVVVVVVAAVVETVPCAKVHCQCSEAPSFPQQERGIEFEVPY
mmetsp:Transcript_29297/g.53089  ORF Transcript_29297/g.53089 Transcript_29297/m.53089 type:complete len:226 (-) Transcript_29297:1167-1844(-)